MLLLCLNNKIQEILVVDEFLSAVVSNHLSTMPQVALAIWFHQVLYHLLIRIKALRSNKSLHLAIRSPQVLLQNSQSNCMVHIVLKRSNQQKSQFRKSIFQVHQKNLFCTSTQIQVIKKQIGLQYIPVMTHFSWQLLFVKSTPLMITKQLVCYKVNQLIRLRKYKMINNKKKIT